MRTEVLDTDITQLEVDAIANAANTQLRHGGGVAGAIARVVRGGQSALERVVFAVGGEAACDAFQTAVAGE